MTARESIIQVINKLFIYTDRRDWDGLQNEVFDDHVLFDVTSLGAEEPQMLKATDICSMWANGFEGIDHIHHQSGNYLVEIDGKKAVVHAYSVASHYKKKATHGRTRTFVGSYDFELAANGEQWRVIMFKYNLKYIDGNVDLI